MLILCIGGANIRSDTRDTVVNDYFRRWLIIFIGDKAPQDIYTSVSVEGRFVRNSEPDTGCIMSDPHAHMKNPLLSFDFDAAIKLVYSTCNMAPDPRFKHVIGTVRGTGGGKTRCFEGILSDLILINGYTTLYMFL